jgi:predicted metalloprotease with PDZ domain
MAQLHYHIGWKNSGTQLIDIRFIVQNNTQEKVDIQLPSWRPGRYELGNFAKNIRSFRVEDLNGNLLPFEKLTKDLWSIEAGNCSEFHVIYSYYAVDLNAGSSYLDHEQLYVNPVNCCVFIPERINESCQLELHLPDDYQIAIDINSTEKKYCFAFENFDRLADTPFIASANLLHREIHVLDHIFHLWFMGDIEPDWDRLEKDFSRFCLEQIETMGALPGKHFHFYFQILPTAFYHGVEHTFSTVCALGPGNKVFTSDFYDELLGVSSHELFHAWNVKTIRPSEMAPYNFTGENYSRLGWVYEGITTWYGDQFLLRSGVFDTKRYLNTLNDKLKRHFTSYGRFNQPVSEASFDTWLDGYVPGIPHRKTSIYVEGSLIAFLIDSQLRESSNDVVSLDDLMKQLYDDARSGKSYSKERILDILKNISGIDFSNFYANYIEGTHDFEPELTRCFARIGLNLNMHLPFSEAEHRFGFRILESAGQTTIAMLAPDSPAEASGLLVGDQIIACNDRKFANNWTLLTDKQTEISLHLFSKERLKKVDLKSTDEKYFSSRNITIDSSANNEQKQAFRNWSKQESSN